MKESTEIRAQIKELNFQIEKLERALMTLVKASSLMSEIKNNLSKIATQNGLWTGN